MTDPYEHEHEQDWFFVAALHACPHLAWSVAPVARPADVDDHDEIGGEG